MPVYLCILAGFNMIFKKPVTPQKLVRETFQSSESLLKGMYLNTSFEMSECLSQLRV